MTWQRFWPLACGVAVLLVLGACGGGSASGGSGQQSGLNDFIGSAAQTAAFLQFRNTAGGDGVEPKGESLDVTHKDWIELVSVNWSLVREFAESAKSGSQDLFTGVTEVGPIQLVKNIDKSSPKLMQSAVGGGAINGPTSFAAITIRPANGEHDVLRFLLQAPLVASWKQSVDVDGGGIEELSLWFYRVQLAYRTVSGTTPGQWQYGSWDRVQNRPWSNAPTEAARAWLFGTGW
ncbi:MAG: type VI secretion system tube protein Hcp [Fimbriimonadaceae bacterium]|nr:type VI secretion system tube protein Hcp [Fimbriimonadaceae bacterium]